MNNRNPAVLAAALVAVAPQTFAQQSPGTVELTPFAGFRFGGTFTDEDDGREAGVADSATAGFALNFRDGPNTQWEIVYARQSTDVDVRSFDVGVPTIDLDVDILQVGGTYLGDGELFRPYLAATIGASRLSPTFDGLESDTFWSFGIGGGMHFFPTSRLGLRLEGRMWGTLIDSSTSLFCGSGPQGGGCAIAIQGDALWQFETFAGLVFRF